VKTRTRDEKEQKWLNLSLISVIAYAKGHALKGNGMDEDRVKRILSMSTEVKCDVCGGGGAVMRRVGGTLVNATCPKCKGAGVVHVKFRDYLSKRLAEHDRRELLRLKFKVRSAEHNWRGKAE